MSDIANELRERSLRAEQEGEPLALLDDAADEIERLRLTDAEREALRRMLPTIMYEPHRVAVESILQRLG
jgi:hypothetical protein